MAPVPQRLFKKGQQKSKYNIGTYVAFIDHELTESYRQNLVERKLVTELGLPVVHPKLLKYSCRANTFERLTDSKENRINSVSQAINHYRKC